MMSAARLPNVIAHADRTVCLLDIRIGGEARVGLGRAAAVGERSAAVVAGAGVDAR